jgi:hypothetical protein
MVASMTGSNTSTNVGGANSVNAIPTPKEIGLSPPLKLQSGLRSNLPYRNIVIAGAFKALSARGYPH